MSPTNWPRGRETRMANTRRRRNSFTSFLGDIIDDSKDLVDDLIDRAKDVEEHGRDAVRDFADDDDEIDVDEPELRQLRSSLEALTGQVSQLTEMQARK